MKVTGRKIIAAALALTLIFAFMSGCSLLPGLNQADYIDIDTREQRRGTNSVSPRTKPDGSAFTLAYVDIDPFPTTGAVLYYIIMGFREEGWIFFDSLPFDPADTDAGALIDWLAARDIGPYIRFDSGANYYTDYESEGRPYQSEAYIRESLENHVKNGTVDAVLTMGTQPAALVKSFGLEVPLMMFGSVDPVGSGLVNSLEDSGSPYIWTMFDPTVYERQLMYYHDLIPFSKLGIVYYDETRASVGSYERAAEILGVDIVRSKMFGRMGPFDGEAEEYDADEETEAHRYERIEGYYSGLKDEFRRLVEQEGIDAFMLTTDIIIDMSRTEYLLEVFTENMLPVFVQVGESFVQRGALMNVSAVEMVGSGIFGARSITQALSGTPLAELPMEFRNSPYLSLNLDVAEKIGFRPTFEMLLASEKIFTSD